jgi:hypothetical protein
MVRGGEPVGAELAIHPFFTARIFTSTASGYSLRPAGYGKPFNRNARTGRHNRKRFESHTQVTAPANAPLPRDNLRPIQLTLADCYVLNAVIVSDVNTKPAARIPLKLGATPLS